MKLAGKRVSIIGHDVGTGLSRHIAIVRTALEAEGAQVSLHPVPPRGRGARLAVWKRRVGITRPTHDVNIFMQDLAPAWFGGARLNILMPNQEWFDPAEVHLLSAIDIVACQSQHAADIFSGHGPRSINMGFTSMDRLDRSFGSERSRTLHVGGRSPYKGAGALLEVWARRPEWPTLTITHGEGVLPVCSLPNVDQRIGHISDGELRQLQNESWLHLQPSEMEAFGHALCEGMSVGGLVLTTDAPPMNELIRGDRGALVPYSRSEPFNMGIRFYPDVDALEQEIGRILALGSQGHAAHMAEARRWYLENDRRVYESIVRLVAEG